MRKIFCAFLLVILLSGNAFAEVFAVVNVPYAPTIAPDGTRNNDVIYGLVLPVQQISGDKVIIQMPYGDDVIAYENIAFASEHDAREWESSITHQVIAPFADIQVEPSTQSFPAIITLPRGAYLNIGEVNSRDARYVRANLFGGISGWVRKPLVRPVRKWNENGEKITRENLVNDAMLYLHTAYRWGGRTPEGVDCSGFTHVVYNLNGLEIYRNSRPKSGFPMALMHVAGNSQGLHTLETLKNVKPGDLIHWSGHVGLYLGGGKYIHANARDFSTEISSLISGDEGFREDLAKVSAINTFSTAFPDEPEKITVREFYADEFTSGDKTGYRFYARIDGYAPTKAIIYPEGIINSDKYIELTDNLDIFWLVYSSRNSQKAPAYFFPKSGNYKPVVILINDSGYKPSGKIIKSEIFEMPEIFFKGEN